MVELESNPVTVNVEVNPEQTTGAVPEIVPALITGPTVINTGVVEAVHAPLVNNALQ